MAVDMSAEEAASVQREIGYCIFRIVPVSYRDGTEAGEVHPASDS
jgi:hypothetical protein